MDYRPQGEVTLLLNEWSKGDSTALERLLPLVYNDLRRIASRHLAKEPFDHTLQPTALINELFLRLMGQHSQHWKNREYFFGAAARLMRRILVDYARRRGANKRGPAFVRVDIDAAGSSSEGRSIEVLALNKALDRLEAMDPALAHLVELRFFGGFEVGETAQILGVSTTTVKREWAAAKAWLWHELTGV